MGSLNLSNPNLGQVGILNSRSGFQPQEILYPGFGLNISPSGGTIPYDNRGGPNGGMELAYWLTSPPQGIFGVSAVHASGAAAHFRINAYEDGKPLELFYLTNPKDPSTLVKTTNYTGTITGSPNDNSAAIIFTPPNAFYTNNPHVPEAPTDSTASPPPAASAAQTASAKPAHAAKVETARPAASPTPAAVVPRAWTAAGGGRAH